MIFSGIIGLFVGAVLLGLRYKLFLSWLKETNARYLAAQCNPLEDTIM
jgi:hypothetical protein